MTDSNESSAPRPFEATPEASAADEVPSRGTDVHAEQGSTPGGAQAQEPASKDAVPDAARDLADRLKPLTSMAESAAVKAIELSAKGLDRLAVYLKERQGSPDSQSGDAKKDDPAG